MKNRKPIISIFLFAGINVATLVAQSMGNIPSVPPSPNAANLGLYGEVPIDYYTGTPNINIPLYTVKNGDIEFDIGLSYHILSNKVEDEASWVGLGWSLNAGGVITRVMRGFSDIRHNGVTDQQYLTDPPATWCTPIGNDLDNFYYNFMGYSGQFVLSGEGIKEIKQSDMKIALIDYEGTGFIITAPDGTTYEFRQKEYTETISVLSGIGTLAYLYPSSWYLTKISSPTKRVVTFNYSTDSYSSIKCLISETINSGRSINVSPKPYDVSYDDWEDTMDFLFGFNGDPNTQYWEISSTTANYINKYLTSIDFGAGTIDFNTIDRTDLTSVEGGNIPQALSEITITENSNNEVVRKINFLTSYFNPEPGINSPNYKRLKLDGIYESANNEIGKRYSFEYNTDINLPKKNSNDKDYWGFYNGAGNADNSTIDQRNQRPNSVYSSANLLTKITYPTGGTVSFEYQGNTFAPKSLLTGGAGNRIYRITTNDGNGSNTKKYEYLTEGPTPSTSGKLITEVCNVYDLWSLGKFGIYGQNEYHICYYDVTYRSITNSNCLSLGDASGGNFVGYDRVTEYFGENGEAGVTVRCYENEEIQAQQDVFPFWPRQVPFENGLIKSRIDYEKRNGAFVPVMEQVYTYSESGLDSIAGESHHPFTRDYRTGTPCLGTANPYEYTIYSKWIYPSQTTTKTYNKDDPRTFVETKTKYYYESPHHKQLTKTEKYVGENDLIETIKYRYPVDHDSIADLTSVERDPLVEMADQHIVGDVVEREEIRDGLTKRTRINYSILEKNVVLPKNVVEKNGLNQSFTTLRLMDYDTSTFVIRDFMGPDKIRSSYIWDKRGDNIIAKVQNSDNEHVYYSSFEEDEYSEKEKTGSKTGIRYMPINTNYTVPKVFPSGNYFLTYFWRETIDDPWTLIRETKELTGQGNISTTKNIGHIDELRVYPENALMVTYCYVPLVGLSSTTDVNNITTYYEYDYLGRLSYIKDNDKNILKRYDYHYKLGE